MSELTSCNFCNLANIRYRAKREAKIVKLINDPSAQFPKAVSVHLLKLSVTKPTEANKIAWFAELTDHCVC